MWFTSSPSTSITSKRTGTFSPARMRKYRAMSVYRFRLCRSTASAGVPKASERRAFTSQNTTVSPSCATMSASPKGVR